MFVGRGVDVGGTSVGIAVDGAVVAVAGGGVAVASAPQAISNTPNIASPIRIITGFNIPASIPIPFDLSPNLGLVLPPGRTLSKVTARFHTIK